MAVPGENSISLTRASFVSSVELALNRSFSKPLARVEANLFCHFNTGQGRFWDLATTFGDVNIDFEDKRTSLVRFMFKVVVSFQYSVLHIFL